MRQRCRRGPIPRRADAPGRVLPGRAFRRRSTQGAALGTLGAGEPAPARVPRRIARRSAPQARTAPQSPAPRLLQAAAGVLRQQSSSHPGRPEEAPCSSLSRGRIIRPKAAPIVGGGESMCRVGQAWLCGRRPTIEFQATFDGGPAAEAALAHPTPKRSQPLRVPSALPSRSQHRWTVSRTMPVT